MLTGLYARLIGLALVIAAVVGGYLYVSHLRSEVAALTTQNVVLGTKLKEQNDAVDQLKKDGDVRAAAGKLEVAAATEAAAKNIGRAKIIYKTLPSTPGNDCKSTLDLFNGVAK